MKYQGRTGSRRTLEDSRELAGGGVTDEINAAYKGTRPKLLVLAEAQNWRCCYCGIDCLMPPRRPKGHGAHSRDEATVEHLSAKANGGRSSWDNEVMACRLCNEGRNSVVSPSDYARLVRRLGRLGANQEGRIRQALDVRQGRPKWVAEQEQEYARIEHETADAIKQQGESCDNR